jgi:hypothetical protein
MSVINSQEEPIYEPEEGNTYDPEELKQGDLKERKDLARKQWEEKWDIDHGIDPYASIIGETLHPKTTKSYETLNLQPDDNVYYASRRHLERSKRNMVGLNTDMNKPTEIDTTITRIIRLKDKNTNKEFLTYDYTENWEDQNGNKNEVHYMNAGVHETVEGKKLRDLRTHAITGVEVSGKKIVFDIPFSKKNVEDILKKHTTTNFKSHLYIATARTKGALHGRSVFTQEDHMYVIRNIDDFKNGSYDDLKQLGERGLSTEKPSLHRLKSPVLSDPPESLWRKNLPVQQAILQQQEE